MAKKKSKKTTKKKVANKRKGPEIIGADRTIKDKIIVLISGKKMNGKDTLADFMRQEVNSRKFSFAEPLKRMAGELFDLSDDQLYSQDHKEIIDDRYDKSPRDIMKEFGAKMREIYPDIWVMNTYNNIKKEFELDFIEFAFISDCRYQNEIKVIEREAAKLGIQVLKFRINRPSLPNDDPHPSETDLDKYKDWDEKITNNKTLEDLQKKAIKLVNKYLLVEV